MEHQADVHPQLRLILPDAGPGCEKNGRRATWAVTTRSGRHQVPVAVLPTAKSLSAFSLKPQSDRLLGWHVVRIAPNGTESTVEVWPEEKAKHRAAVLDQRAAESFEAEQKLPRKWDE